ncbi:hypothetical protein JAAARDRAFT_89653, partial [Jaapia argillacea MUCL 33604]
PINLPKLTTLRITSLNNPTVRQVCAWKLPTLTRLIVHKPPIGNHSLLDILHVHGGSLERVEFGPELDFFTSDHITPSLAICPRLRELSYHIFFVQAFDTPFNIVHRSLQCIQLHVRLNQMFNGRRGFIWPHIENHFSVFSGPCLPVLARVVLHGESWKVILQDPRFLPIHKQIRDRG